MKVSLRITVLLAIAAAAFASTAAPVVRNANGESAFAAINTDYNVIFSIEGGIFPRADANGLTPIIMTHVGDDGSISVCSPDIDNQTVYIYEYSSDMQHKKTLRFNNELPKFGAFTKDKEGNYYVFYGKNVEENEKNTVNMVLVKYNGEGAKINVFKLNATGNDPFAIYEVKKPFDMGSCRMEISGDWIIVYFATIAFKSSDGKNHQSSWGFVLDKNRFERVDTRDYINRYGSYTLVMPWASNSFNQYILPIENGFVSVDHGDGTPRSFYFNKILRGQDGKDLRAFRFPGYFGSNVTYAQMGGLAKTSSGYIFAGTYERNVVVSGHGYEDSRNLFILYLDGDFTSISEPVWITNYTNKETEHAANPKIAALGDGRHILMWEFMNAGNFAYITTFMLLIDEKGKPLGKQIELPNVRLNINDALRYNKATGNVHWAVNNGSRQIILYALNPDNPNLAGTSPEIKTLPSGFIGTWERIDTSIAKNTLTVTSTKIRASNQYYEWIIREQAGDAYTFSLDINPSEKYTLHLKLVGDNLEIVYKYKITPYEQLRKPPGEDNWTGMWRRIK